VSAEKNFIGLITARGGSKSIPRKNILPVGGKPLIVWTIEAALASGCLERVILSTEDDEIARLGSEKGVEVPFLRPEELAQDDSPHIDAVLHAILWLAKEEQYTPEYVVLLQPTSPLRTADDISAAVELARERNADSVVSVSVLENHPYLTFELNEDGTLRDFMQRPEGYLRRQVLPPAYALNGSIYVVRRTVLFTERTFLPKGTFAYIMPGDRSIDIDTPWDMHLVDLILSERISSESS
jgi:CMP-N,N'-diacetyllegionaminic acid synthase